MVSLALLDLQLAAAVVAAWPESGLAYSCAYPPPSQPLVPIPASHRLSQFASQRPHQLHWFGESRFCVQSVLAPCHRELRRRQPLWPSSSTPAAHAQCTLACAGEGGGLRQGQWGLLPWPLELALPMPDLTAKQTALAHTLMFSLSDNRMVFQAQAGEPRPLHPAEHAVLNHVYVARSARRSSAPEAELPKVQAAHVMCLHFMLNSVELCRISSNHRRLRSAVRHASSTPPPH